MVKLSGLQVKIMIYNLKDPARRVSEGAHHGLFFPGSHLHDRRHQVDDEGATLLRPYESRQAREPGEGHRETPRRSRPLDLLVQLDLRNEGHEADD